MAAYLAIEPGWLTHPKVHGIHRDARSLWIAAGLHAVANETDGRIEKRMLPLIATLAGVSPKRADDLVAAGLWIDHGDHYEIHDFLKYNQSKAQREAQREKWRRAKAKAAGVTVDSTVETNGNAPGIPQASLPYLALPTEKALGVSAGIPPRNGDTATADQPPPNPPTDEGRAEIAKIRTIVGERGHVAAEQA
jgi:hypothetical protein